jgi:hypothetical protein
MISIKKHFGGSTQRRYLPHIAAGLRLSEQTCKNS